MKFFHVIIAVSGLIGATASPVFCNNKPELHCLPRVVDIEGVTTTKRDGRFYDYEEVHEIVAQNKALACCKLGRASDECRAAWKAEIPNSIIDCSGVQEGQPFRVAKDDTAMVEQD